MNQRMTTLADRKIEPSTHLPVARNGDRDRLIALAESMVSQVEVGEIVTMLDSVLKQGGKWNLAVQILAKVRDGSRGTAFNSLALFLSRASRMLAHNASAMEKANIVRDLSHVRERLAARLDGLDYSAAGDRQGLADDEKPLTLEDAICKVYGVTVGRSPSLEEMDIWKANLARGVPFHEFLLLMGRGQEAKRNVSFGISNGEFVQLAHENVQGRGAGAYELDIWLRRLESGEMSRSEVLSSLFDSAVNLAFARAKAPVHDGLSCRIMGSNRDLSADQWTQQAKELQSSPAAEPDTRYKHRFHIRAKPQVLVSVLTSLYRGGDFIEQFMDNMASQTCFDDYCELIIVDADSPEDEYQTIKRYLAKHKNINYLRMNYRIGIYDAWNLAAKAARGQYLTNANVDDIRRADSFELQAGTLDNLPFVDIVYQDIYYTFDPRLSIEQIAAFGHETNLPVITPHNIIHYNSPHNAPMWRKSLHDELGYFDIHYRSAGDYDFWLRCLHAGKTFYKINDPHVAYYQNPQGLSTRPDTPGLAEAMEIHKNYCRKLIPKEAVIPTEDFVGLLHPERRGQPFHAGHDRYTLAQHALRDLVRNGKFSRTIKQ